MSHRRSAAGFFSAWVVVLAVIAASWQDGMSVGATMAMAAMPFVAGLFVGTWHSDPQVADARPCGMLAGALVAAVDITQVFVLDWKFSSTSSGHVEWGALGLWIVITGVFSTVGAGIGFAGGLTARVMRKTTAR